MVSTTKTPHSTPQLGGGRARQAERRQAARSGVLDLDHDLGAVGRGLHQAQPRQRRVLVE